MAKSVSRWIYGSGMGLTMTGRGMNLQTLPRFQLVRILLASDTSALQNNPQISHS